MSVGKLSGFEVRVAEPAIILLLLNNPIQVAYSNLLVRVNTRDLKEFQ